MEHADKILTGGFEDRMERVLRLRERSSLFGVLLEKSRKLRLRERNGRRAQGNCAFTALIGSIQQQGDRRRRRSRRFEKCRP